MEFLLERLRRNGWLAEDKLAQAEAMIGQGLAVEDALLKASGAAEEDVLRAVGEALGVPYIELDSQPPEREFLAGFPARLLMAHALVPWRRENGAVLVATSRVCDSFGLDELRLASGQNVRAVLCSSSEISRCLNTLLGVGADTLQTLVSESNESGIEVMDSDSDEDVDLSEAAQDASIIKFVNQVLTEAIERRATDVHFEPFESALRVRYRVDGMLQEASIPPEVRQFQPAIVSRLKILSHLDIAEKRLPQDGRIKLKIAAREIDVRVSIIPMLHGEAVVLRLLDRGATMLGMEHLGMDQRDRTEFEHILELPHGIVLVTGPTGSGKTTTLYAGLSQINDIDRKIITIEDPIEYHLHGINQIQVSTKTGLTFGLGLRSILRHDPDVILIGEIRDRETAEIAVQASLTGHLVFSTLHTNDAPGAVTRLVDMGIEPYLVASSLEMVLAQRLVRVICPHCREEYAPTADDEVLRGEMGDLFPKKLYRGTGCRKCLNTGYRGRQGIFEAMPVTESIRSLIVEQRSSGDIRRQALAEGMRSLRQDGWRLVREGKTTLQEVLRSTKDEHLTAMVPGNAASNGGER